MANKTNSKYNLAQSNIYQIQVRGHLDQHYWSDWFEGMKITPNDDGTTLIVGPIIDDAALHGLLKRVRDSGLRLLSVNQIENDPANEADSIGSDNVSSKHNKEEGQHKT